MAGKLRELTNRQLKAALAFLESREEAGIFLLGYLHELGIGASREEHLFDYHGFYKGAQLQGIMSSSKEGCPYRGRVRCLPLATDMESCGAFAQVLLGSRMKPKILCGDRDTVRGIMSFAGFWDQAAHVEDDWLYVLTSETFAPTHRDPVRQADRGDIEALAALGTRPGKTDERYIKARARTVKEDLKRKHPYFVLEHKDGLVAAAKVVVQTDETAMIGAVEVAEAHRRLGFPASCMSGLAEEMLKQRKRLYHLVEERNQAVTHLCEKLGFVRTETVYTLVFLK